ESSFSRCASRSLGSPRVRGSSTCSCYWDASDRSRAWTRRSRGWSPPARRPTLRNDRRLSRLGVGRGLSLAVHPLANSLHRGAGVVLAHSLGVRIDVLLNPTRVARLDDPRPIDAAAVER